MNVLDFFNKENPLKQIIYPGAQIGGNLHVTDDYADEYAYDPLAPAAEPNDDVDYAEEYRRKDEEDFISRSLAAGAADSDMLRMETASPSFEASHDDIPDDHDRDDVFRQYNFTQEMRSDLVMSTYEQTICELVSSEQVLIIQGPTGCGKSTQVPQYILNWSRQAGKYCRIAVTQPRRIAAITVARRVSQERGWPLGTVVGYRVGLDAQTQDDTLITYMTTGVLLQQLVQTKNMNQYTHIILDEVHERDQEMDFLLLVVRKFCRQHPSRTRIILMSATFDTDQFSRYFSRPRSGVEDDGSSRMVPAPVLDVVKPTAHAVHVYHLDQLCQLVEENARASLDFDINNAKFNTALFVIVKALLDAFDKIDCPTDDAPGSVLVFLPGIYEIEELYESLHCVSRQEAAIQWFVVPLHSSITVEEQKRAFEPAPAGLRKIILSTNIAESSVTVPDVVYVIDFCLTKIMICDPATNYCHLKLTWASRSSCVQRAGRVGRVRTGRVYRFVYQKFFERQMPERTRPEILRCPLHRLVLLAKSLDMGSPQAILALALDRPDLSNIRQTIDALKEAGGLLLTTGAGTTRDDGHPVESATALNGMDGDLTELGRIMAKLPLDIHCARLIVFGHMFGVLRESVIMAAAMSLQSIFSSPFNERMRAYTSKLTWAHGSFSDLIAYLHVYMVWEKNRYGNSFGEGGASAEVRQPPPRTTKGERAWMQKNFLQPRVMREWRVLVNDLRLRLARLGVSDTSSGMPSVSESVLEKAVMIKVVICGAFYPNYFVRSSEGGQVDEATAVRTLGGRDPFTTVYFSGKPPEQPGQLYVTPIRAMLKDCGADMHVSFDDGGSGKVYVQFRSSGEDERNRVPGKVAVEVYRAVKYRQLKLPTVVRCLSPEEGRRRLELWRRERQRASLPGVVRPARARSALPGPEVEHIELTVIYVESPGRFFAHNLSDLESKRLLEETAEALDSRKLDIVREVVVGETYAAPFERCYYRARAAAVSPSGPDGQPEVRVVFVDYGNSATVVLSQLRHLPTAVRCFPPLAMECTLCHVGPSIVADGRACWSKLATEEFCELTKDPCLFGKVFSVVDGVVSLELYRRSGSGRQACVNDLLTEGDHAQPKAESYLSQDDHARRTEMQRRGEDSPLASAATAAIEADPWTRGVEQTVPPPPPSDCHRSMTLKGPFSPLEMQAYSLVQCSVHRTVGVERSSVNSALLDTDPQDGFDRLLVAGGVSTNADGSRLTLRHTTMMPNLLGFPAVMALLFAPRAVAHTDRARSRVTSLLCGLGCEPETFRPRYPHHDVVLNLDFELTDEDVRLANEIREYMNMTLEAVRCGNAGVTPLYSIETCQYEIHHRIRELLARDREPQEKTLLPRSRNWRHAATPPAQGGQSNEIWPKHPVVLVRRRAQSDDSISRHLATMHDIAAKIKPMSEIICQLCNVTLRELYDVRLHLISQQHVELERLVVN